MNRLRVQILELIRIEPLGKIMHADEVSGRFNADLIQYIEMVFLSGICIFQVISFLLIFRPTMKYWPT